MTQSQRTVRGGGSAVCLKNMSTKRVRRQVVEWGLKEVHVRGSIEEREFLSAGLPSISAMDVRDFRIPREIESRPRKVRLEKKPQDELRWLPL
ncbi:hypothetical protein FOZ61_001256 [Perkinsus olseni]|uniref:Uncharacterized protein n=1 Tax=Perkinsus olseni TaxID=32597 RepID=A0A7J6MF85_PEROL|nr:hypothetical protein FOZ61_001256 [Perkinsus olseni]KAF4675365.1 hypothetical protein FOL46_001997 [Perkinsus olseni]